MTEPEFEVIVDDLLDIQSTQIIVVRAGWASSCMIPMGRPDHAVVVSAAVASCKEHVRLLEASRDDGD